MGLNFSKKILLNEEKIKTCSNCNLAYHESTNFCAKCGSKLTKKSTKVYANIRKKGITITALRSFHFKKLREALLLCLFSF